MTRTQLGYGLSRLYGAYADRDGAVAMQAFPTLEAAAEWLDARRGRQPGTTAQQVDGCILDRQ